MGHVKYKSSVHNPNYRWPRAEVVVDFDSYELDENRVVSFKLTRYGKKLQEQGLKIGFPNYFNGKLRCECIHKSEL